MTFHAYGRARRLGRAIGRLRTGASVTRTAFEAGYESLSAFYDAFQKLTGRTPVDGREVPILFLGRLASPIGVLVAAATDKGVCLLEFSDRRTLGSQLKRLATGLRCTLVPEPNEVLRLMEGELESYFAGSLRRFSVPVTPVGTRFQQRVWQALSAIPYGETRSYARQAEILGRPQAVRAVASANGANHIAIVIPCHRVVGADGRLSGYGGGVWRKRWLLEHEQRATRGIKPG
jgi:AraC family transcriptional regulator of adaptative response/methylated-DNA-[protein]-cysteine methyltransferase